MVYTPCFFPLKNAVCFIILTYLVPALFTFYIQGVLKLQKKCNSGAERLTHCDLSKSREILLQRHRVTSQKSGTLSNSTAVRTSDIEISASLLIGTKGINRHISAVRSCRSSRGVIWELKRKREKTAVNNSKTLCWAWVLKVFWLKQAESTYVCYYFILIPVLSIFCYFCYFFTYYHTPTCFDTFVSSSGNL